MKRAPRSALRRSVLAASVAACFTLSTQQAAANPTGPSVVSGSAAFAASGSTLTVTNSANAIINWQGFSIGINEITRFLQSSSGSAVLNRVVGANGVIPQSVIDGMLQSNGRVFLLNPMGVVIGQNARIDVAGLVASSLNLSNDDFLAGRTRFTEVPGAGAVVNNGIIQTSSGGRVFLVAPSVENNGVINAPQGEIFLAAGKSAELVNENSPLVTVRITADAEQALNVGSLIADAGRIGMYGAVVRNAGVAEANGAVAGPGGTIRLVATKDLSLDAGSRTRASGTSGGDVLLQAEGGTNLISGTVEAKGSSGSGGNVQALGVRVGVIGHGVIDASGETGGGTVLVGGDYQGKNADVQNAQQTLIGPDGVIRADAGATGDGGRVIVWSDDTRFYGSVSARGGSQSGNGGFVETSGHVLDAVGAVNVGATNGNRGTWLIDPFDLNIVDSGMTVTATSPNFIGFLDAPATGTSTLGMDVINSALLSYGSVTAQAQHDLTFMTSATNVMFNAGVVTAYAGNNINLGSHNIVGNGTKFVVNANSSPYNTVYGSGTGSIISDPGFGNVSTGGGAVVASGYNVTVGNIDTTGASSADTSVNINGASMVTTGSIMTGNATGAGTNANSNVFINAPSGIVVNGGITTGSANSSGGSVFGGSSTISLQSAGSGGSVIVHGSLSTGAASSSSTSGFAWSEVFLYGPAVSVDGSLATGGATSGGSAYTDVTFSGPCCTPTPRNVSIGGSIATGNSSGAFGNSHVNVYGSVSGGTFSVGGGITTGNAPSSSFVNLQSGDIKVGSVVTGTANNGSSGVSAYANTGNIVAGSIATGTSTAAYGNSSVSLSAYGSVQTGSVTTGGAVNTSVLEMASYGSVVTGAIATAASGAYGNSLVGLLAPYGSVQAGALSSGSAYGSGAFAFGMGDVSTGGINVRATDPSFSGGLVSLFSYGGSVNVSGVIDARGADGTAAHPDGSAGGPVLISALNSVAVGPTPTIGLVRSVINTSGGAGAAGGAGGAAGPILVDPTAITFNGTLLAVGGAGNGAPGGAGGLLFLDTTNGVGTVTFINGGYDVSGGTGSPPGANGLVTINGSIIFITLLNPLSDPSVAQSFGTVINDMLNTNNTNTEQQQNAQDEKKKKGGFSSCRA